MKFLIYILAILISLSSFESGTAALRPIEETEENCTAEKTAISTVVSQKQKRSINAYVDNTAQILFSSHAQGLIIFTSPVLKSTPALFLKNRVLLI